MTKFNLKAALAATLATSFLAAPAMAQDATGSFDATAQIIKPLTMTITDDLGFGSITLQPTMTANATISVAWNAGTSTVDRNCDGGSGDILCGGTATVPHVEFSAGVGSQTVDLEYPGAPTVLTRSGGTETLAFTHTGPLSFALVNGAGDFYIGGTVTVPANAAEGTYSATVPVEATYQ